MSPRLIRASLFAALIATLLGAFAWPAFAQQSPDEADPNAAAQSAPVTGDEATAPDAVAPNAAPSPAALDLTFLNLSAYDVEPIDRTQARVGDQLTLRIVGAGNLPPAGGLRLGLPKGTEPGTVLDQGLDIPALSGSDDAEPAPAPSPGASPSPALAAIGPDLRFSVIAAKPGQIAIPSLAILDGTGKAIARTNPFTLQVASAIAPTDEKPKEPAPPRPPVTLSFPWVVIAALGLLAFALLGGIVYGVVRASRRKKEPPAPEAPPAKSEDEIALGSLAELEKQQLMRKGLYKSHYFQLSETLKAYLGARYQVDAVESTTREMIAMLEHTTLPPESLRELGGMFTQLDFVKFTDRVPEIPEGEELLTRARALVLRTRKPPQTQPVILPGGGPGPSLKGGEPRAV